MIELLGEQFAVVDAHVHVWNKFAGTRFGDTPIEPLGFGMVRQAGREYRFLPPEYHDNQAPIEILLAHMETTGVDKAVILQNPCYGDQRDYVRSICQKYPGRFVSLGMIDPRNHDEVRRQMDILMKEYRFAGFKIEVPDVPFPMDDPAYDFLWKKIVDMDAVVTLDLGWNDTPMDFNIDRLTRVVQKYPAMRTVLAHLGVSRLWDFAQKPPYPHLQKTLDLLDINRDNLYLDFSGLQTCEPTLEYPYARCLDILKTTVNRCGVDRLMWGSDAPMILRTCTFRQTLTCFTSHVDFLDKAQWRKVLSENAEKVYFRK